MKELIYNRMYLPTAARLKDQTLIIDGAYTATFGQHTDRVSRLTHALRHQLGVKKGDRFAVMAMNSHQYLELYHAAFLGAGVINPLNLRLAGKELDYIVRDSGTEVVFVDSTFAPMFAQAMATGEERSRLQVVLIGEGDGPHDIRYEDLLSAAQPLLPEEPEEEDPVVLMYTGGTTGLPKGVLVSQRAEMLNVYHIVMRFSGRMAEGEISLLQTPMFHAASIAGILGMPGFGGTIVTIPMFEPSLVLAEIARNNVTQTTMVPTMIGMVLAHPEFAPEKLASLQSLTYGASPMPAILLDRLMSLYPDMEIAQGYGMTESSSVLTFLGPAEHKLGGPRLRSVGRPVPGIELSIQDESGTALASGEIGEVCAKGGNFMDCYWNKQEATVEAFLGGWYHTGDAGYLDEGGYLFLVDRVKDMIVSGGENVYSAEVENAIASHPGVAQVAVIGIPHELWVEQVHAIVVLKPGAEVSEEQIQAHAKESIAGYKTPKSVEFRTSPLPLSGAMKVLKRELRKPYWEGKDTGIS